MAIAERYGRVSPAVIRSHFNCWLYSYSDVVHSTYISQAGYTWQYSNNFNFLQEVEPSKLLNCSHHLKACSHCNAHQNAHLAESNSMRIDRVHTTFCNSRAMGKYVRMILQLGFE